MTSFHSDGDVVKGFQIVRMLGEGGYTVFYLAQKDGRDIFLKQYKEPTPKDEWFNAYVDYEQQVKNCIQTGPVKNNVYDIVDIFEWKGAVYQALEYVPNQTDLLDFIYAYQDDRPGKCKSWDQRVIFAKMLMNCIKKLHASKIVHCDLKPQNIVLIRDERVRTGYLFRIADLDWSIIEDAPAPWEGYMGTDGYRSPEHIRGEKPTFASDVFTCGIILYQLLCNYSPLDNDKYNEWALSYDHYIPVFLGQIPDVDNDLVGRMLEYCIHPDPKQRPTAEEVHQVLLGRLSYKTVTDDEDENGEDLNPVRISSIKLQGSESSITANINTGIGKPVLQTLCGEDGRYASNVQYTLVREGSSWYVMPNPDAVNETLLNGKKIVEQTPLKPGDQLGVGREEKGIVKAIVTVQF